MSEAQDADDAVALDMARSSDPGHWSRHMSPQLAGNLKAYWKYSFPKEQAAAEKRAEETVKGPGRIVPTCPRCGASTVATSPSGDWACRARDCGHTWRKSPYPTG